MDSNEYDEEAMSEHILSGGEWWFILRFMI